MKARLVDVAREAGVSPKTVSNYLNGYPFMSERTTERVRAAIDKLDYVPNQSARTLRTGKIGIIGVALPNLQAPYFGELAALLTEAAEQRGYTLLIDQTGGDLDRELRAVRGIGPQALDGLILSPLKLAAEDVSAARDAQPLVVLGEWTHPAGVPYVGVDNVAAARAATQHLLSLDRRRIAAIGTISDTPRGTWGVRITGYRDALTTAGLATDERLEPRVANFHFDQGASAMSRLLDLPERPDAVFCFSDMLAIGALSVLHRQGVRVPDDVAVMGWDDITQAQYAWPPLTSVRAQTDVVARTAVDYLLRQIDDQPIEQTDQYVDFEIVVRDSTIGRAA
ncbi:LacI family DNA-binding transcriptional regulator [Microlunatus sp. Gsoil 973]|uniref:LacI family DNA-binding transcriptional regulator n=1 Tax=Microlunatus sp. Gsoil 973 TaxID=2672569 RepID=UPI0012B50343|nr:LacI family DNA-binding transcriptional regulator [Microlunatus sp. Gsoil 973]QGN31838.1 LacI family DNA-binding transcriptional regulator [Microlunatus sp. Gsoil 973]